MNTPTLCLVMDGERIVSYEVVPTNGRAKPSSDWYPDPESPFRTIEIPLSLCALAPEMKECLKSVSMLAVAHREFLKTTEHAWMLGDGSERIENAQSLLSKLNQTSDQSC